MLTYDMYKKIYDMLLTNCNDVDIIHININMKGDINYEYRTYQKRK